LRKAREDFDMVSTVVEDIANRSKKAADV